MKNNIRLWENLQFLTLVLLIVGQCTVGANFWIGQCMYLGANIISVVRCFILVRPMSDKFKDCCCFAITVGLMAFKFLTIRG